MTIPDLNGPRARNKKYPRRTNTSGGFWFYDPPAPGSYFTNVDGLDGSFEFGTDGTGKVQTLPPAFWFETRKEYWRDPFDLYPGGFGPSYTGNDPTVVGAADTVFQNEWALTGRVLLQRTNLDPQRNRVNAAPPALYVSTDLNDYLGNAFRWGLFYGKFSVTYGPYAVGGLKPIKANFPEAWWLASWTDGFEPGFLVNAYYFHYNLREQPAIDLSGQSQNAANDETFDPLGSNRFRVYPYYYASEQYVAIGGVEENISIDIHAYWP